MILNLGLFGYVRAAQILYLGYYHKLINENSQEYVISYYCWELTTIWDYLTLPLLERSDDIIFVQQTRQYMLTAYQFEVKRSL